jgi:arylsulfatase A-like enzyme
MKTLRPLLTCCLLLVTAHVVHAASAPPPAVRPNVIVILTDDQGAGDAGCYGAKDLDTPAIDGQSLVPVLQSASAPSPHTVLHWLVGGGGPRAQWAVREGDWKLVSNVNESPATTLTAEDKNRFHAPTNRSRWRWKPSALCRPESARRRFRRSRESRARRRRHT